MTKSIQISILSIILFIVQPSLTGDSKMKILTIIKKAFVIVSVLALTSTNAYAHSVHDHSNLPLKWHFSDAAKAKVIAKMASGSWNGLLGLSKLEQKIFNNISILHGF